LRATLRENLTSARPAACVVRATDRISVGHPSEGDRWCYSARSWPPAVTIALGVAMGYLLTAMS
jgi:hypothetical protein